MARVYLETSFVSACVTDRTDVASQYRREVSRRWWESEGGRHDLFVSEEVLAELSAPSFRSSSLALDWARRVPILAIPSEARGLAAALIAEKVMPGPLAGDAVHVAVACWYRMDYLLSWNVRHLANPNKAVHLRNVCQRFGHATPEILTPEALWEFDDEQAR